ncbi:MAG: ribosome biogenesis GTPase Der [Acidithiobacillales bacterium]
MNGAFRVAIVGRPNVGKSALFNRLLGRRRALVHDRPGMTRDALEASAATSGGRHYLLMDTGGLDLDAAEGFAAWTSRRALATVGDADLLLLVLDGAAGLLPEDRRVAAKLRTLGKPVVAVWNKADTRAAAASAGEAHELGFPDVVPVSALHGAGQDDLDALIEARIPPDIDPRTRTDPLSVAIIGRPNVGKSSLVNALVGADRVMVSDVPGTTRDAVDVLLTARGRSYLIVDTAGLRRKGRTTDSAEKLAIVAARQSLERARVAVVVLDAAAGVAAQDAHIAGYAGEAGRALVLVANKWDLIEKEPESVRRLRDEVGRRFVFTRSRALLPVSAKTGRGIGRILPEVDAVASRFATRLPTGELNRLLRRAFERQSPAGRSGRELKIRYVVQVRSGPPLIRLFADRAEKLHFAFERYLQNRLREAFPLDGVPVRFEVVRSD